MAVSISSDLVTQKIASAGGMPSPLNYERAVRSYAARPRAALTVESPLDALGYPIRDNPISFGETLQGRPPANRRVATSVPPPESALELVAPARISHDVPALRNHLSAANGGKMIEDASRRFVRADAPTAPPLKGGRMGTVQVISTPTPNLIPRSDLRRPVSVGAPAVAESRDPVLGTVEIPVRPRLSISGEPRASLDAQTDRSAIPFKMPAQQRVVLDVGPVAQPDRPARLGRPQLGEPAALSMAAPPTVEEKPPTLTDKIQSIGFSSPLISFSTAMGIARNFSLSRPLRSAGRPHPPERTVERTSLRVAGVPTRPSAHQGRAGDVALEPRAARNFTPPSQMGVRYTTLTPDAVTLEPATARQYAPPGRTSVSYSTLSPDAVALEPTTARQYAPPPKHTSKVQTGKPEDVPLKPASVRRFSPASTSTPRPVRVEGSLSHPPEPRLSFEIPGKIPSAPPAPPIPNFSLSTLEPEKFHIRG